jgi:hypothetical protein
VEVDAAAGAMPSIEPVIMAIPVMASVRVALLMEPAFLVAIVRPLQGS